MVLAFVIFISAVVFAVYILFLGKNAIGSDKDLQNIILNIEKNVSTEVVVYPVLIKGVLVNKILAINLSVENSNNVAVINLSDNNILSEVSDGVVYFDSLGSGNSFKIMLSKDIINNNNIANKPSIQHENYTIGPAIRYLLLSEKRVKILNASYYLDYDSLRRKFSSSKDFLFSVYLKDKIIANASIIVPSSSSVYRFSENKEFLTEEGLRKFGKIEVSVW